MSKSDEQIEQQDRKRQARATSKALPPTARKGGGVADWSNANADDVLRLVCTVGVEGGAVRFGYTRDGGAYSIGIYLGADSQTYYCNESEGINGKLAELIEYFKG
jgi:hypothetical protein